VFIQGLIHNEHTLMSIEQFYAFTFTFVNVI